MMLLSRFWYGLLSLLVGVALYVAYVGVGQYNRRAQITMAEGLASDSQVVRWALQIDARRRLDALLLGAVDKGVQDSLVAAAKDKVPPKAKEDGKKALDAVMQKLPPEVRPSALFAVDRDGRVVAQVGYDQANAFEDFELGGYPAVYDALHGFLRDDTWILGGRMYRVVARPVEEEASKPPVGAIVAFKIVDDSFAKDIARLTRANVMFFGGGVRLAQAVDSADVPDRLVPEFLTELPKVEADKAFKDTGRSGLRLMPGERVGAIFARLDGDAWELRGAYAVARGREFVPSPIGFLSTADDKDKANVPWVVLGGIVGAGLLMGLLFSVLEHTMPLRELARQGAKLRKGELDLLQLPRLRGGYRGIGQDLNAGIQRVAEKGGGAIRKEADLESILGPTPAQPAMSAFSFPMPGDAPPPSTAAPRAPFAAPSSARAVGPAPLSSGNVSGNGGATAGGPASAATVVQPVAPAGGPPKAPPAKPPKPPPPRGGAPAAAAEAPPVPVPPTTERSVADDEERTTIGAPAKELLAQASPSSGLMKAAEQAAAAGDEGAEWLAVYEEFLRTKKECGENVDGLTYDKFRQTLRKNRDALIQRHGCKRVKFTVYVKEGRAALKASPVKE